MLVPFRTVPSLRARVWGGSRLTPPGGAPIGESWLVGTESRIVGSTDVALTLGSLVARHGADLIGTVAPPGTSFPLLIKLLDPAEWLSVQVHPDDEQAKRLEGSGAVGKTEGWYFIETAPDAAILLGADAQASPQELLAALRAGRVAHLLERRAVRTGDACLVPAGTLHAVGPGALVYEIQQPSDITYRCDDWGRPATAGRALHTRQSVEVARLEPWTGQVASSDGPSQGGVLLRCEHFVLEYVRASREPAHRDTRRSSVHVVTGVTGPVVVAGEGWSEHLEPGESLVVPAAVGAYRVADSLADGASLTSEHSLALIARLPDEGEAAAGGSPAAPR